MASTSSAFLLWEPNALQTKVQMRYLFPAVLVRLLWPAIKFRPTVENLSSSESLLPKRKAAARGCARLHILARSSIEAESYLPHWTSRCSKPRHKGSRGS